MELHTPGTHLAHTWHMSVAGAGLVWPCLETQRGLEDGETAPTPR